MRWLERFNELTMINPVPSICAALTALLARALALPAMAGIELQ